jgi:two-component system phosphate regulon sensor histidine kinase PhoR
MWAINRLLENRWAILASALISSALILAGALSVALGMLGFALVCATILAPGTRALTATLTTSSPPSREAYSLLQSVMDALPDPVVAINPAGLVVAVNAAARKIAPALRPGEAISLGFRMPALIGAVRRAIATGKAERAEFSERSVLERWYEVHVIPSRLASPPAGSPTHFLLTFHDLTQHRRIEQMRADFVANASHELRTPLAALSGFIDTLRGPAANDAAAHERFLPIMHMQTERMARLIDDLLSLSRIELREHIAPDTPVELKSVLREVIDSLQPLAHERAVEVSLVPGSEPLMVRGDRDELIRVFENLVENAVKYGASGKRVDILLASASGQGTNSGEAKVSVRDYGPGIGPEHLPRLTERFYRVDVEQSRAAGGTGLGLALVKHSLNRHGGRLIIESNLGQGSTFTVALPLSLTLSDGPR